MYIVQLLTDNIFWFSLESTIERTKKFVNSEKTVEQIDENAQVTS